MSGLLMTALANLGRSSDDIRKCIDLLEKASNKVWINFNDDVGENQFSVQIEGTDYWVESFDTGAAARKFCERVGLGVIN